MALRDQLPRRLALRFDSLSAYVNTIISESEEGVPDNSRLSREQKETVATICFAVELNHFFQEGTAAAERAVDQLAKEDISGFAVGSTLFSQRNENVLLGARLSQALREMVDNAELRDYFDRRRPLSVLVRDLMARIRSERRLG